MRAVHDTVWILGTGFQVNLWILLHHIEFLYERTLAIFARIYIHAFLQICLRESLPSCLRVNGFMDSHQTYNPGLRTGQICRRLLLSLFLFIFTYITSWTYYINTFMILNSLLVKTKVIFMKNCKVYIYDQLSVQILLWPKSEGYLNVVIIITILINYPCDTVT